MARKATAGGMGAGGEGRGKSGGSRGGKRKGQADQFESSEQSQALVTTDRMDDTEDREQDREQGRGSAATDAILKLLQSPLVADLLAVAATAALAALAEHGFNSRGDQPANNRRAGRAVKEAGKAAAAAIGRRIATEVGEVRSAARKAKDAATA